MYTLILFQPTVLTSFSTQSTVDDSAPVSLTKQLGHESKNESTTISGKEDVI